MAPLAVPHHFLRVSPFAITSSCAISWELKGERCVSYVKQVALAQDAGWFVCISPLPPSLCLSLPYSFVSSLGSRLGVGFDHWQKVAMVRFLWRSTERFALQL